MTNPLTEAKKALDRAEAELSLHRRNCPMLPPARCWVCWEIEADVNVAHHHYHQLLNDEDEK